MDFIDESEVVYLMLFSCLRLAKNLNKLLERLAFISRTTLAPNKTIKKHSFLVSNKIYYPQKKTKLYKSRLLTIRIINSIVNRLSLKELEEETPHNLLINRGLPLVLFFNF